MNEQLIGDLFAEATRRMTGSSSREFSQKFTELIVRECILTIQMGITRDGHNTEKYLRSMKHIEQIKEHFGVES